MSPRLLHDADDLVYACPECGRAPPYERTHTNTHDDTDCRYACYDCGARFGQPIERRSVRKGRVVDPDTDDRLTPNERLKQLKDADARSIANAGTEVRE